MIKTLALVGTGFFLGALFEGFFVFKELADENLIVTSNMDGTITFNYRNGMMKANINGPNAGKPGISDVDINIPSTDN